MDGFDIDRESWHGTVWISCVFVGLVVAQV